MRDNLTNNEPLLREPEPELVAAYGVVVFIAAIVGAAAVIAVRLLQ